jgi:hypothetical protein
VRKQWTTFHACIGRATMDFEPLKYALFFSNIPPALEFFKKIAANHIRPIDR